MPAVAPVQSSVRHGAMLATGVRQKRADALAGCSGVGRVHVGSFEQIAVNKMLIAFVAELLRMVQRDQEELWTICPSTKNHVLEVHRVYQGSLNSSMILIGEVFREAIKLNAAAIIVCHNHPNGAVDASPEDILVTRQIVEAGKLLDTDVLDHIILGKGKWLSMRERGLGF